MRKIWITCGWVLSVTGVVLVVMMGLAWLGGGETLKIYAPFDNSEAARGDQAATHRMIIQAIWISGLIVLVVALVIGLLMCLVNP